MLDGKDKFVSASITSRLAYHPCNDVSIIWICKHVVQPGREVGARLFMLWNFPTLLNVPREILVGVINITPSVIADCTIILPT